MNGDFKVDFTDLCTLLAITSLIAPRLCYNPAADFNHDGKIDFNDISLFTGAYINYLTQETALSTQATSTQPSPAPTSAPTASNSLPLSCLGDDYLCWSNWNGDPSYWASQLHWFTEFHCNTARLGFKFADDPATDADSTYSYAKMNVVLNYLSSVGVKAILVDQNGVNPDCFLWESGVAE